MARVLLCPIFPYHYVQITAETYMFPECLMLGNCLLQRFASSVVRLQCLYLAVQDLEMQRFVGPFQRDT